MTSQADVATRNSAPEPDARPARRGLGAAWWTAFSLLLLGIVGLALYLWLRQPEVVVEWRNSPPDPKQVAELERLNERARELEALKLELEEGLAVGQCTALDGLPLFDRDELTSERTNVQERRAQLAGAPGSRTTEPERPVPPGSKETQRGPVPEQEIPKTAETSDPKTTAESVKAQAAEPPGESADGKARRLAKKALVEQLDKSTVLILALGGTGKGSTGTGFFVAPQTVVTNRHVVEGAGEGSVFVTSRALGKVHKASVEALSAPPKFGGEDFAILRVGMRDTHSTFALTSAYSRLDSVVAAGFPGASIKNDVSFQALIKGDVTASPELETNLGEIQAIQTHTGGGEVIRSSTGILQGNSGGPLVDSCGRVIGVNTFISVDESQAARLSYALSTKMLRTFLDRNGVGYQTEDSTCPGE